MNADTVRVNLPG